MSEQAKDNVLCGAKLRAKRELNNAHVSRMKTCDTECAGVGYCAAVWQSAY